MGVFYAVYETLCNWLFGGVTAPPDLPWADNFVTLLGLTLIIVFTYIIYKVIFSMFRLFVRW